MPLFFAFALPKRRWLYNKRQKQKQPLRYDPCMITLVKAKDNSTLWTALQKSVKCRLPAYLNHLILDSQHFQQTESRAINIVGPQPRDWRNNSPLSEVVCQKKFLPTRTEEWVLPNHMHLICPSPSLEYFAPAMALYQQDQDISVDDRGGHAACAEQLSWSSYQRFTKVDDSSW